MKLSPTALLLSLLVLWAAPSAWALDLHQTCDDVLNLEAKIEQAGQNADTNATQKLAYCKAAQESQSAATSNGALWKVWAGVAGVCTTACLASFAGVGAAMGPVCTYSGIGAGVTDAIVTKNFMGGLMSVGTSLAGKFMGSGGKAADGSVKKNWAACLTAATATLSTFTDKTAESQASDTENQNLTSAAALGPIKNAMTINMGLTNTTGTAQPISVAAGGVINGQSPTATTANVDPCKEAQLSGGKTVACAASKDPGLANIIGNPAFNPALQNAAGTGLNGFVDQAKDPGAAIAAATGTSLGSEATGKLGDLVAAAGRAINTENAPTPADSTYAGGGGGAGHAAAPEGDGGMGEAMAKLMGGLNPGATDTATALKNFRFVNGVKVPSTLRGPASEDDRNISLFDRVTYRYYFVGRRIILNDDTAITIPSHPQ
jgi:hypothetical protein